jgi:PAS domain S-box-containing protein
MFSRLVSDVLRRKGRKQYEWLSLLVVFSIVTAALVSQLVAEIDSANASKRENLVLMNSIVVDDIENNIKNVNETLEGMIQSYVTAPVDLGFSDELSQRLKFAQIATVGIRYFLILDVNGVVKAGTEKSLLGKNLNYEEFFKLAHTKPSKTTLYVSRPFQSFEKEKDMVITISRMVAGPDGKFAGLAVAMLDPGFFDDSLKPIVYVPDAWGFVIHGGGRVLTNFPRRKGINGSDLSEPGTVFSRHFRSGQTESVMTGAIYGPGEQELVVLRTVQSDALHMDQVLLVGLAVPFAAIAQPLHRKAIVDGLVFAVSLLLCCAGLSWVQKRRTYAEALIADLEWERREADERIKRNQLLSESEAHFRTLIEDAPLAIAMLRGGHFVYANPRYRSLHGYPAENELTGLPWSAMISPESRAAMHAQEALILEDSPVEQTFEAEGLDKEGRRIPVFKTTTRVMLADGPATLIFAQDISAQKHAEAAMLQARDAAEAANRSKADFLANMSHEIRSPMNAILGLAYLLEQAHLDPDAHSMVRKIRTSGRMLLGIINDILDVSKIDAGHLEIERAPFRLDEVMGNVAVSMGIAAGDKNIQLIIQPLPAGISSVMGDALRLEQVLNNLTSNAIKFTAAGHVELRISLLSRDEEKVVLRFAVHDTGIGIAPELQGAVFSAFTQADSSTTRRFGGTGLGLTICRQLVSLMGGEIGLNSTPGQGSEFWFTVPLQLIASTEFSSPDMVRIEALIADDSDITLQALSGIAHGLGWQVNTVDSGEAALTYLLERKYGRLPTVVVLEWKMPGMDGLATVRAIRECMAQEQCPIILMAATHSLSMLASQPGAELVDAILHKPVTASTLYNAAIEAQRRRTATDDASGVLRQEAIQGLVGVRVLIVDDSEINRDVAERILSTQGAIVSLAVDGKTALDWLLAHPDDVDLVLMDVQMPVMDGIEATRQLRLMPQFNGLPIVALTAGAFKPQQDAARAAGMTHFISKPFDVPSTVALIQQLCHRPVTAVGEACSPVDGTQAGHADIALPSERSVIDMIRGLKIWSDVQTYRDYLRRFAESYGDAVATMHESLAAGDLPAAAALAHKLAGVAANLALPDTHRLAVDAERALSSEYDATFALACLGDALGQAMTAIEQFAPHATAQAAPAPAGDIPAKSRAELRTLFADLLEALDTDNPGPVKPILARLLIALPSQELADIRECVRDFDFRGAEVSTIRLALNHGITLTE